MTKEIIEGIRKVIVPFVKKRLVEINYEGLGESDAKEFDEHMNEILDLATKALEQQDVTYSNFINKPCGDIISRQDALLCCIRGEYPFDSPQGEENARIESEIRKLPAVEPMIKTGYWILTKEDNDLPFPTKWYKCSECGREICEPTPKFCDECGTKIIGIKDEAEKWKKQKTVNAESGVKDDNCAGNDQNA